ncbi:MAG: DUF4214 domain-containing protein [Solobacterium sp.]|nr:DUF4214 domain-containing protein [Solobacterium sp.]
MLRSIVRRFLKLVIISVMFIAYLPASAVPVLAADLDVGISGLSVSYDSGSWSAAGNSLSGSATGKAKGTCDDAASQTSTLTLTNRRSSAAQLSFDYSKPVLAAGGSVKIDGTAVTAAGSFVREIPAGGSVTVVILSGNAGAYTSSVSLTNISLITSASVTTTFRPAEANGTYQVDSETITETKQITRNSTESYLLTAQPAGGYKLEGWYSETQGAFLSRDTQWRAYFETPQTIRPVFIPTDAPVWEAGEKWFTDLNEAVSFAESADTEKITLMDSGTLSAGTYTIPAGKSVLIPYDNASTLIRQDPVLVTSSAPSTPSAFRKLTMASGARIIVNGTLAAGGRLNSHNNGYTGANTGAFGWIAMNSGSSIALNSGSFLYCWGYITGAGTVTANPGSKVYEPFEICDIRGGTATSAMHNNDERVFPVSQYYVQNIEAPLTILYGAALNVVGTATVQGMTETPNITFAGSSGALFTLTDGGSLTMRYDPAADRNFYDIYGSSSLNSFSMNVGISINSASYVLPLMENTTIRFHSGTTTCNQDICLIPGFEGIIDSGAVLKIASGKSVYVYDRDQWIGNKFLYPGVDLRNSYYSPTRANANKFSAARMADAKLDVNGTLEAAGRFCTTAGGADIISSEGTGSVVFTNTTSASSTYQAVQANTSISYTEIPVTSARLHNGSPYAGAEEEYTDTSASAEGDTYTYDRELQKWGIYTTYTVSFDDGSGSVTEVPVISGHMVPEPEDPEKEGYVFAGWYNGETEYDFTQPVTEDLILKAKWEKLTYVLKEWKWNEDFSQASAVFVSEQDETITEEVSAEITVEVTEPTCTEDGVKAYTAEVSFDGQTYTDTKEESIPASGHSYGTPEYTWSEDLRTVNARAVCTRDKNHTVEETAQTAEEVTVEPKCETAGEKTLTAVFENEVFETQTRKVVLDAPGHDWDDGTVTKEPGCEEPGIRTYTCRRDPSHTKTEEIPALGHKYQEPRYVWSEDNSTVTAEAVCEHDPEHVVRETVQTTETIRVRPTCETPGERIYTAVFRNAQFAKQTKTAVMEPLGHLWDEGTVVTPPECEKEGTRRYTCQRDHSHTKTETIPALDHIYGDPVYTWAEDNSEVTAEAVCRRDPSHSIRETAVPEEEIVKEAACAEAGERRLTAVFRNALFSTQEKTEEIAVLGHAWGEWIIVKEASEEEAGEEERTCQRCGEKETRAVPPLGHTHHLIHKEAIPAKCEEDGRSEYWVCDKCGKYFADMDGTEEIEEESWIIPALGHKYGNAEYIWSEDNNSVSASAVCEHDPSHVITETVTTTRKTTLEPACETEGIIVITAVFENKVFTAQTKNETVAALGHDWDDGTVTKAPSCEETGIRTYTCRRDPSHTKTEEIPALGHVYQKPEYEWSEDCSTVTAKAVCERDHGHVVTETVRTTETVTVEPKCETPGEKLYTAVFRNILFTKQTRTAELAPVGHDWTEWEVVKEPTKTEPGLRQRKCRRCGETETEEIPVIETVAVTSVELDKTELALKVGESETLTATVLPENADDKSVTWSSSDPSVVTVDENGKVTAVADNGMEDPSTAVITVTTNDGGYTAECTVTSEDPINGFVRRLYSMCLGRKADEHGFKDWTGWLRSGKLTAAQTVQGFFNSPEMEDMELTDEEWVEKCYAVILDRESEAEGKAFWADLRGSGVSNNFILKGFVESREFAELCAKYGITPGKIELTEWRDRNPGVTKFVNRCYTKALGRKAEAGGLNSWCRRILSASNKKAEAIYTATTGFFHSPEFLNKKTTDEEYVTILYRTFLGREPEPEGFNDWVNRLKSGMSRDEVMMGFANSKEFDAIMKECGIE